MVAFLLSLVVVCINIYWAGLDSNIVHLENDRDPEAGVSLLGYIIFPLFFLGVTYVGNLLYFRLGFYAVLTMFSFFVIAAAIKLPKTVAKYKNLLNHREGR